MRFLLIPNLNFHHWDDFCPIWSNTFKHLHNYIDYVYLHDTQTNHHNNIILLCTAKKYVDQKLNQLTAMALDGKDINDGSFLGFLAAQDKLSTAHIYSSVADLLPASIDTVSQIYKTPSHFDTI